MGRLKARMGELGKKLPLAVAEGQAGDGLGEEVMERLDQGRRCGRGWVPRVIKRRPFTLSTDPRAPRDKILAIPEINYQVNAA